MDELQGKVAVVTGAASGIGRALAERFAREGMKLVLADVDPHALRVATETFEKQHFPVLAVRTDVSRADDVSALAERTLERFGTVHVVCNNAGVFAGGPCWEAPLEDYEWVLGVNLWGVIHGIRSFVPVLLRLAEADPEFQGHVVNTASMAAVTCTPMNAPYTISKHAVLALSETLFLDLQQKQPRIGVSALCPEVVATRLAESPRNRPEHLRRKDDGLPHPERDLVEQALGAVVPTGAPPARMADRVVAAMRDGRFYILSEEGDLWRRACHGRLEAIRQQRNPSATEVTDDGLV